MEQLAAVGYNCELTSTLEATEQVLALYPNPSSGHLMVGHPDDGAYLEVYAMTGTLISRFDISGTTTSLNLGNLRSGIYLISLISSSGRYTQKLQIN